MTALRSIALGGVLDHARNHVRHPHPAGTPPAVVITAALAAPTAEDQPGPWLARHWGSLADIDPDLLAQIDL
jgi:hypothetical protein